MMKKEVGPLAYRFGPYGVRRYPGLLSGVSNQQWVIMRRPSWVSQHKTSWRSSDQVSIFAYPHTFGNVPILFFAGYVPWAAVQIDFEKWVLWRVVEDVYVSGTCGWLCSPINVPWDKAERGIFRACALCLLIIVTLYIVIILQGRSSPLP
jgi:hypothetical protein